MRLQEAVISGLGFLFISTFLEWLGLNPGLSLPISALLIPSMYLGEKINLLVGRNMLRDKISKPIVIPIGNTGIYQTVDLDVKVVSEILVNFSGAIIPLLLSSAGLYRAMTLMPQSLWDLILLTFFLALIYNRLTKIIRGSGLGLPLITVLTLTIIPSLAIAEILNNPPLSALITFSSSTIATLVGVDLLNLRDTSLFKAKYIIIGGMGLADAAFLIPLLSSLLIYVFSSMP